MRSSGGLGIQIPQRQDAVAEGEDVEEAVDAVFAARDEGDDVEGFGWGCHFGCCFLCLMGERFLEGSWG